MILLGDSAQVLKDFNDECVDLTVTSPPYDNLRTYEGNHEFNFEVIAQELYRVTKKGGIVVWIVGDSMINGSESGTSFKQALYFKDIGFKLHDTMIYDKRGFRLPSLNRYHQVFEYMFILVKGNLKTFNPLKDKPNTSNKIRSHRYRRIGNNNNLQSFNEPFELADYGTRYNIWNYSVGANSESNEHPAIMPEKLVEDHIKSWSNEGDLILDPFMGSGTTAKAAHQLNRKWIGIEINPNYIEIAKKRLKPYLEQTKLMTSYIKYETKTSKSDA